MNKASTVAVVIPTYNCGRFLAEAVASALDQTRPPHEVVVINDGSTDDTDEIIRPVLDRTVYIKQANAGVSNARNVGIKNSTADWLLFLDADDRLEPTALEAFLRHSETNCVVFGDKYVIDEAGRIVSSHRLGPSIGDPPMPARKTFNGALFEPGAAIVPRWLAERVGGFNPNCNTSADRNFWIRCGALVPFQHVPEPVFHYRDRLGSMSKGTVGNAVDGVRAQILALAWCQENGLAIFEREPRPCELVYGQLRQEYWKRNWLKVDALLSFADEHGYSSRDIEMVRRRRKLPNWIFSMKDAFDKMRGTDNSNEPPSRFTNGTF